MPGTPGSPLTGLYRSQPTSFSRQTPANASHSGRCPSSPVQPRKAGGTLMFTGVSVSAEPYLSWKSVPPPSSNWTASPYSVPEVEYSQIAPCATSLLSITNVQAAVMPLVSAVLLPLTVKTSSPPAVAVQDVVAPVQAPPVQTVGSLVQTAPAF